MYTFLAALVVFSGAEMGLAPVAGAAGVFVPAGNGVQINFTASAATAALYWDFIFTGVHAVNGTCPNGGTFQAGANNNPFDGECIFSTPQSSGVVMIVLDSQYSCSAQITDRISVNGQSYLPEPPITCNPNGNTTTTTQATTVTDTTIPPPCKCDRLTVDVRPSHVATAQGQVVATGVAASRVILQVSWTLTCSVGTGKSCSGRIQLTPPAGGATTMNAAVTKKLNNGGKVELKGKPLKTGLAFSCTGPCAASTVGWFFVQSDFGALLEGKTLTFDFVTTCSGQQHRQRITLVYRPNGSLDKSKSTLKAGKTSTLL